MNIKERVLELNMQNTQKEISIADVLLTIITRYQLFEPCKYLAEDDEWLNVSMISVEDESISQAMSIRKSEIVMFGIFNREEIELFKPKSEVEEFYQ